MTVLQIALLLMHLLAALLIVYGVRRASADRVPGTLVAGITLCVLSGVASASPVHDVLTTVPNWFWTAVIGATVAFPAALLGTLHAAHRRRELSNSGSAQRDTAATPAPISRPHTATRAGAAS